MITDKEINRIDNPINKQRISIVVVGYNRLKSIQRLLASLLNAQYPHNDIPLVISIDCSGCTELYDYVQKFEWPHGEKYVFIQEKRLGLKEHIFHCGDLTKFFKAIILLEDDLFVSPYFYDYVLQTVEKYGEEDKIAEISLYKNERNGYVGLPFSNMQNGSDVFLMQDVGTWGECWTKQMWEKFRLWYQNECTEEIVQNTDMPSTIKVWTKAWSKYYNAYVVRKGKYVLYPNVSLSTNFNDAGEHASASSAEVQVSLQMNKFEYRMLPFDELARYDIYFNNEGIYKWIGKSREELTLDLYGFHSMEGGKKYLLSTKVLPFHIVTSYALCLRPIELNIKYNIQGKGIFLYNTDGNAKPDRGKYYNEVATYFLQGFNGSMLASQYIRYNKMSIRSFVQRVINKLRRII